MPLYLTFLQTCSIKRSCGTVESATEGPGECLQVKIDDDAALGAAKTYSLSLNNDNVISIDKYL